MSEWGPQPDDADRDPSAWDLLRLLAVVVAICAVIALIQQAQASTPLLVVGDSIAAGWGATEGHGFAARLGAATDARPGATTADFLDGRWTADTVIVELGTNDAARGVSRDEYAANLRTIVGHIDARRVIVVLPYPTAAGGTYDVALPGVTVIRAAVPISMLVDGVHPGDDGHALLAAQVRKAYTTSAMTWCPRSFGCTPSASSPGP